MITRILWFPWQTKHAFHIYVCDNGHDNNIVETKYRFSLNVLLGAQMRSTQGKMIRVGKSLQKILKRNQKVTQKRDNKVEKGGGNVLLGARLQSTQGMLIRVSWEKKQNFKELKNMKEKNEKGYKKSNKKSGKKLEKRTSRCPTAVHTWESPEGTLIRVSETRASTEKIHKEKH